jgi:hypothetical protein
MRTWFPVLEEAFHDVRFLGLRPSEKLLFWALVSDFNLHGSFYRADLEYSARLRLSEITVRAARRHLKKLGFVEYSSGYRNSEKNFATHYKSVKWSKPLKNGAFSQIHRYTFDAMLAHLRNGHCTHNELVVYVYLMHRHWLISYRAAKSGVSLDSFYISKNQLRDETGISKSVECVNILDGNFRKYTGGRLFDVRDDYHKLTFSNWVIFSDPSVSEVSRQIADAIDDDLKRTIVVRRQEKEDRQLKDDDLVTLFRELYRDRYNRGVRIGENQRRELVLLGEQRGVGRIAKLMREFMARSEDASKVQDVPRTLSLFLARANVQTLELGEKSS